MAAFTAVTDGFELSPAHFAEIVDAVNERRAAAVASGATGLPAAITATGGTVIQIQGDGTTKPVHLLIQEMLEALAAADVYVDHGAAVPVGTLYSLASWRSRAGLNSSGFRRATAFAGTAAPTYSYGLIQTGDIAGYWIWEDIVAGLQALQWTRKKALEGLREKRYGYAGPEASYAAALAAADIAWAAESWVDGGGLFGGRSIEVWTYRYEESPDDYYADISGRRSVLGLFLFANAPVAADVLTYFVSRKSGDVYYDIEGKTEDEWNYVETLPLAADAVSVAGTKWTIEAPDAYPAAASGHPGGDSVGYGSSTVWGSDDEMALLKWDFSRA